MKEEEEEEEGWTMLVLAMVAVDWTGKTVVIVVAVNWTGKTVMAMVAEEEEDERLTVDLKGAVVVCTNKVRNREEQSDDSNIISCMYCTCTFYRAFT